MDDVLACIDDHGEQWAAAQSSGTTPPAPSGGYSCVTYYNEMASSTQTQCAKDCPAYVEGMAQLREGGLATHFTECTPVSSVWCYGDNCKIEREDCESTRAAVNDPEPCLEQH